ncbi:MAG: MFS transporter [Pirellulales bacterium]
MNATQTVSSNTRWRILALLMAFTGLTHFNRISMSVAGTEHLMDEFGIEETTMGWVYSAYLIVYTCLMTPGGWLIDRIGPKRTLLLLAAGSALLVPLTGATALIPPTLVLTWLIVIRGLLGAINVPLHPGTARAASFWMAARERGMANGLLTGAAVAGIAATYFVFGSLMDALSWPWAFVTAGVVTLMLALVWAWYGSDRPETHPAVSTAELAWIEQGRVARPVDAESSEASHLSWADFWGLLKNRSLLLLTISYATVSYFQYLFFYWMQYYFDKVLKLGTTDGRLYATIPLVAMALGMAAGGWLADHATARFPNWFGRSLVPALGMIGSALFLLAGIFFGPPWWVVTCFALAMGALGASESPFWVAGVELGGRRGGLSAAILNTVGNAGGLVAPIVTPLFSERFGWQWGLAVASVLCLLGAVLWPWIDPERDRFQG